MYPCMGVCFDVPLVSKHTLVKKGINIVGDSNYKKNVKQKDCKRRTRNLNIV